jgi:hypothetical protein
MYWYLDKQSNKPGIFSSLMALHKATGINYDTLTYHFSRKKRTSYDDFKHRIEKVEAVSSTRAV